MVKYVARLYIMAQRKLNGFVIYPKWVYISELLPLNLRQEDKIQLSFDDY